MNTHFLMPVTSDTSFGLLYPKPLIVMYSQTGLSWFYVHWDQTAFSLYKSHSVKIVDLEMRLNVLKYCITVCYDFRLWFWSPQKVLRKGAKRLYAGYKVCKVYIWTGSDNSYKGSKIPYTCGSGEVYKRNWE